MHTCPDCGQACCCSGDIEDIDTGDEFYVDCCHFLLPGGCCEDDEEFEDEDMLVRWQEAEP